VLHYQGIKRYYLLWPKPHHTLPGTFIGFVGTLFNYSSLGMLGDAAPGFKNSRSIFTNRAGGFN